MPVTKHVSQCLCLWKCIVALGMNVLFSLFVPHLRQFNNRNGMLDRLLARVCFWGLRLIFCLVLRLWALLARFGGQRCTQLAAHAKRKSALFRRNFLSFILGCCRTVCVVGGRRIFCGLLVRGILSSVVSSCCYLLTTLGFC